MIPINGYLPKGWSMAEWREKRVSDPKAVEAAARASMRDHVEAMVAFWNAGVPTLDYGNNIRQVAATKVSRTLSPFRASCRPISAAILPGHRPLPLGGAVGRSGGYLQDDAKVRELTPGNTHLHNWLDMARERISFQGLPARICWVGLGDRHRLGLAFNEMVAKGELKAPVVIGRDHLDSGSVASPNRETRR